MRKIYEVLRLHFEHDRSKLEIARIISVSPSTVSDYVVRAKLAGLSSPLPPGCDDATLERLLFTQRTIIGKAARARVAGRAQRTAAQGCDAGVAVAGVQGRAA